MRVFLHIGPDGAASDRLQRVLDAKRAQLAGHGVLFARSPGARNHTRLFMAATDPGRVDSLRFNRGFLLAEEQATLRAEVVRGLTAEVERARPHTLILSAHQLGCTLVSRSEFRRLREMLAPLSEDVRVVAHIDDPARMLVRRYAAQLMEGRARALDLELGLLPAESFWDAALATGPAADPKAGQFAEVQGACHWLDFARLQREWETVFGAGRVHFRGLALNRIHGTEATEELRAAFDIAERIGRAEPEAIPAAPSAAWLSRARLFNDAVLRLLARTETILPRQLWRKLLGEIKLPGAPIAPGSLSALSKRFEADIRALCKAHPGLEPGAMKRDRKCADWQEADPGQGFRASQYLMAFQWRIKQAGKAEMQSKAADLASKPAEAAAAGPAGPITVAAEPQDGLSACARAIMPPLARQNFDKLRRSGFAPHNRLGHVDEESLAAAFAPAEPRGLPGDSTGNVIVGCMKNEAPYVLEWVAYHRAMGVDDFLIYTNGCEDGTTEILDRLQALGIVQHRNNDDWSGNSPQQHALDSALREPVIRNAAWIIHIDVDEFINVRCGNGTLQDFFDRVPDATNVAMTWRLFGHNGVTRLEDRFVIDQFDTAAPKFCPKPHTVWGFKTMFRNIGAYAKISCHRPNKLLDGREDDVHWVNGSGRDMTAEALRNGWRNSRKTVGYDLLQLNHYALRSAESFLIKRQRGRALHVDRSIGLNYWIRMDWSVHRDVTIKRNLPRMRAEYERLLADPALAGWHAKGLAWHRAKADALRDVDEFESLYRRAVALELTEMERVAYALALDMES